jgi:hypothetical protein
LLDIVSAGNSPEIEQDGGVKRPLWCWLVGPTVTGVLGSPAIGVER